MAPGVSRREKEPGTCPFNGPVPLVWCNIDWDLYFLIVREWCAIKACKWGSWLCTYMTRVYCRKSRWMTACILKGGHFKGNGVLGPRSVPALTSWKRFVASLRTNETTLTETSTFRRIFSFSFFLRHNPLSSIYVILGSQQVQNFSGFWLTWSFHIFHPWKIFIFTMQFSSDNSCSIFSSKYVLFHTYYYMSNFNVN